MLAFEQPWELKRSFEFRSHYLAVEVQPLTEDDLANKVIAQGERIRVRRNQLLAACDYTQLPDNNDSKKAEWATYRQALRDLPEQTGFPDVEFPKDPYYVEPVTPLGNISSV